METRNRWLERKEQRLEGDDTDRGRGAGTRSGTQVLDEEANTSCTEQHGGRASPAPASAAQQELGQRRRLKRDRFHEGYKVIKEES